MKGIRSNLKYAADQIRLLIAEKMIGWAVDIAPKDHPDSVAIYEASLHVASRKPASERRCDKANT